MLSRGLSIEYATVYSNVLLLITAKQLHIIPSEIKSIGLRFFVSPAHIIMIGCNEELAWTINPFKLCCVSPHHNSLCTGQGQSADSVLLVLSPHRPIPQQVASVHPWEQGHTLHNMSVEVHHTSLSWLNLAT